MFSCIGGYPLPFTIVRTCTLRGRNTIIMVIIMLWWPSRNMIIMFIIMLRWSGRGTIIMVNLMLSWWLVITGVWPKELSEYARLTRKVTQRCANWLVSPYSHVWVVCRVYGTYPNYLLVHYRGKMDLNDRSRHYIRMFLHLTPTVESLAE